MTDKKRVEREDPEKVIETPQETLPPPFSKEGPIQKGALISSTNFVIVRVTPNSYKAS